MAPKAIKASAIPWGLWDEYHFLTLPKTLLSHNAEDPGAIKVGSDFTSIDSVQKLKNLSWEMWKEGYCVFGKVVLHNSFS